MKTTALAIMAWLAGVVCVYGQPGWESGLFVGGSSYLGDLVESRIPYVEETKPAFGAFARVYLSPSWSLRADLMYAFYSGDDRHAEYEGYRKRNFSFDARAGQAALLLELDLLGKRRYSGPRRFRETFSPFFFGGIGLGKLQVNPSFGTNGLSHSQEVMSDKEAYYGNLRLALPAGMGLRLDLSHRMSISGIFTTHYMLTDYLDGISMAGNPDTRDWLLSAGIQLTRRMIPRDSDGDGIADKDDACRTLPGVASAKGCPDTDGDGVEDAEDTCPDVAGLPNNGGCPDSDSDGIMDLIDECPQEYGFEETRGCPDRDNDCIADAQDKCPDQEGLAKYNGCPDTDNDGFPDNFDPCPLEAGLADNGGCPLPDTDCDGVLDRDDACPRVSGADNPLGCPDTDNDGLADHLDRCPDLPGKLNKGGCPDLEEKEKKVIASAMSSIRFKTGSAILLTESKKVLDEIVSIMRKYPYYSLRIEGYTDSRGDDNTNLRLSQKRAKACYEYLLYKGIGPFRLAHSGFGEARPIASNKTEAGRKLNRRVEFTVYFPE